MRGKKVITQTKDGIIIKVLKKDLEDRHNDEWYSKATLQLLIEIRDLLKKIEKENK